MGEPRLAPTIFVCFCGESATLGVHGGDSSDGDDIFDVVTGLENVHGSAHAQQDGTDGFGICQAREELVGDIGRVQIGEDQHIGVADLAEGVAVFNDIDDDGGIGLHLAIDDDIGAFLAHQLDGARDFIAVWMGGGAEVGEGQHGHARIQAQGNGEVIGEHGDFRERLGIGIDIDGGVGEEVGAVVDDHQIDAGSAGGPGASATDLQGPA